MGGSCQPLDPNGTRFDSFATYIDGTFVYAGVNPFDVAYSLGATTNSNGVVEYGNNDTTKDSTLKYNIKDLILSPGEVVVPANGEAVLVKLPIPEPSIVLLSEIVGLIDFDQHTPR